MATAVDVRVNVSILAKETNTTGLSQTKVAPHLLELVANYATGTASNQQDRCYSTTLALAAAPQTLDLAGSLTDSWGAALTFVEITAIVVRHKGTTTAEPLKIGAGSNPLLNWVIATGDGVQVGPGGILLVTSPIDGFTVTATTGDILTFDPGTKTFDADILILGRSA